MPNSEVVRPAELTAFSMLSYGFQLALHSFGAAFYCRVVNAVMRHLLIGLAPGKVGVFFHARLICSAHLVFCPASE